MFAGFWHQIPFIRIVIPIIIGIGINLFFPIPIITISVLLSISLLTLFIIWKVFHYQFYNNVFGVFFNASLLLSGIALHSSHNHLNYQTHYTKTYGEYLVVEINEPGQMRKNSIKCKANVLQVISQGKSIPVDGNLMIYFEKDSTILAQLKYGTRIIIKNTSQEIKGPQNPYEFNYKRYLAFNQIYRQAYITKKPEDYFSKP